MTAPEPRFGKYLLLSKIAAGGMAVAYRAEMEGAAGVKKRVVLKVIHPHLAVQKSFVEMFIREARVAASLTHGNIAQIFDFGEVAGRYYLSMEEVVGQPLSRVLKVARDRGHQMLPVPVALHVTLGVLEGLSYAHTRKDAGGKLLNLVHRDVSPENILLSYEAEVKLVDFGIAKTSESGDHTEAGMVRGKYPYLSPEQGAGDRDLDARTDVWAAGVVLYDMLCGRRPYEGEFLPVMRELVVPTPVPSPRAFAPGLDPALEALVLGALKKNRDERYATAREFSAALTSYLHERFPASTRQDVQYLLVSLFAPEAGKEGVDTTVPPDFASALGAATAAAMTPRPGAPPPPGGKAPEPDPSPRLSAPPLVKPVAPDDDDDGEATVAMTRTGDKPTPAPPKSSDSGRTLKPLETRAAPAAAPAVPWGDEVKHAPAPGSTVDDDDAPTQAGFAPKPPSADAPTDKAVRKAPPPADPAAKPKTSSRSGLKGGAKKDLKPGAAGEAQSPAARQRAQLVRLALGAVAGLAVVLGFIAWSASRAPAAPKPAALMQLWVSSVPQGAETRVDGRPMGRTPMSTGVEAGEHVVSVELAGYLTWTRTVNARPLENLNLRAELELPGLDAGPAAADAGASPLAARVPDAAAPTAPAVPREPSASGDNGATWPRRFLTLRVKKMALPLDEYATANMDLNPKTSYAFSTLGAVSLGPGRATSTLMYFLDGDTASPRLGLLSPAARVVKGATRIRVFALDDDASDNSGTVAVMARISQYVPERTLVFDARKHAVVPKAEHQFLFDGLAPSATYLVGTRGDQPTLAPGKEGRATHLLCLSEGARPRPLSQSARLLKIGGKFIVDDTAALRCFLPDDHLQDDSGSVELDVVDAAKAKEEGVDPAKYGR